MKHPKVSIIILNWNGVEDTIDCIESLKKITYSNYEIIVVDNASEGNDVEILKQKYKKEISIIENNDNKGFAIANNIGIKKALRKGTDYLLLLNNDTIVDSLFLDELIKISENNKQIGIIGPKIYYMNPPNKIWSIGGKINWYFGHWQIGGDKDDNGEYEDIEDVDFITGACMLIKKDTIKKIGLLPTDYFLQWEDIDYCTKAKNIGLKCICLPKSKIWHKVSASFKRNNISYPQVELGFKNRIIFRKKFLSNSKFIFFLICYTLVTTPAHLIYYIFYYKDIKRLKAFFKGSLKGFILSFGKNQ